MSKLHSLILILCLVSGFAAQAPAPATVEGIVTHGATGEPVPNVLVVLRSPNGPMRSATTTPAGRFIIEDVPPGQNLVLASGKGFVKTTRAGRTMLMLRADEHRRNVRLQVQPPGVISGRILDENRRPKSSIGVQLLRFGYENGRRILLPMETGPAGATTDDRGEYRMFNLEPGEYLVGAMPARVGGGRAMPPPIFYPGVTDPQLAVALNLLPGAELAGIDFALITTTTYPVRFKVAGLTPGTNLMIRTLPRNGPPLHEAFNSSGTSGCATTATDSWTCNLTPGQYDLIARTLPAARASALYGSLVVEIGNREVDAGVMTFNSSIVIPGSISVLESVGKITFADLDLLLRRIEPGDNWFSSSSEDFGGVQSDGTVKLEAFEGRYYVDVAGLPESVYVESARYAGRNVLDSGLTIDRNSTSALEVSLNGPTGRLDGQVRNARGEPVPSAFVAIIPAAARRDNPRMYKGTITDDVGSFSVKGLAPGEYSAIAFEDADPQALSNRTYVERFEQRAVLVTIERGDAKQVTLTAILGN